MSRRRDLADSSQAKRLPVTTGRWVMILLYDESLASWAGMGGLEGGRGWNKGDQAAR